MIRRVDLMLCIRITPSVLCWIAVGADIPIVCFSKQRRSILDGEKLAVLDLTARTVEIEPTAAFCSS